MFFIVSWAERASAEMLWRKVRAFALAREQQMYAKTFFLLLAALLLSPSQARAQNLPTQGRDRTAVTGGQFGSTLPAGSALAQEQLSSDSVSRRFFEIAHELAGANNVTGPKLEQAIVLLTAAIELDNEAKTARRLLIELACRRPEPDRSKLVYELLVDYADEFADLDVAETAVAYLLEQMNTREEREKFLEQILDAVGGNSVLGSALATMLGTLKAEKGDSSTAELFFMQAYKANRYNRQAFDGLAKLAPEQIGPAVSLERLRLALRENPSDIEAAIAFAGRAEKLQLYETAEAAYQYCADLFRYLYESEAIPARIYLPWAISAYNTKADQAKCLQIARRIRQESGFDLRLEAVAGKAAIKLGDPALAMQIFHKAEEQMQEMLSPRDPSPSAADSPPSKVSRSKQAHLEQFAWFYCFALLRRDEPVHVNWAHEAFAGENSPVTSSLLAYALATDNQIEWAKPLIGKDNRNQIADLTQALIHLAESQTAQAIESLYSAIAKDPGSFAAERAREILAEQGKKYTPPNDPNLILASLENAFGQTLAPAFTPPEQVISTKLDIQGDTFPYGSEFTGIVAITNNSSEPFVISDDGLFKGNIRIDAEITGDLSRKIPNLVFTRDRTTFLAAPGRSILVLVRLFTGELRDTLLKHPQATLDIEFTLYIDPVVTQSGKIVNRLTYVKPARTRIRRPGVILTKKRLKEQFQAISTNRSDQKIKTAQLFIGLLLELQAMSEGRPPYRYARADWVTDMLRSALLHESGLLLNRADSEWAVKVYTMSEMLPLSLDYELMGAVAENMNNAKWPVRMMALSLLASSPTSKFGPVLDSTAKRDPSKFVRDMAIALSGQWKQP